jgi:hypothetical protein
LRARAPENQPAAPWPGPRRRCPGCRPS